MAYKKIRYNDGEGLMKIKVEDQNGALLENWTIMWSDLGKWADSIKRKYGIRDKVNKDVQKSDRDLDWL